MQAAGVQFTKADAKFVADSRPRRPVEAEWVTDAEAKGLKDAAKVLAEFRAEIAKLREVGPRPARAAPGTGSHAASCTWRRMLTADPRERV